MNNIQTRFTKAFLPRLALACIMVIAFLVPLTSVAAAPTPGTNYTLRAVHSGKCLDVQSPNTADGSKVGGRNTTDHRKNVKTGLKRALFKFSSNFFQPLCYRYRER